VPDLVSDGRSKAELVTHNSEKQDYFVELSSLAQELEYKPIIHKLVLNNIKQVIDSIPECELIMNVCDGSDVIILYHARLTEFLDRPLLNTWKTKVVRL
jgi:hypothetical protein